MNVSDAIKERRAYRSLKKFDVDDALIRDLAGHACLSPSCFNKQPWRYVFVTDPDVLSELFGFLSRGNEWASAASMIIAVFSEKNNDCVIKEREYYLFDTGMSVAFIILRATELGLVAHPIAGYKPEGVKKLLNIPDEMNLITLIIVGKHDDKPSSLMSEKQVESEKKRPPRLELDRYCYINTFKA